MSAKALAPQVKANYGFGIVGCGMGAFTHAMNFLEMERCEGVAVFSRHMDKAVAFCEKWKIKRPYDDYDKFLADPELVLRSFFTLLV